MPPLTRNLPLRAHTPSQATLSLMNEKTRLLEAGGQVERIPRMLAIAVIADSEPVLPCLSTQVLASRAMAGILASHEGLQLRDSAGLAPVFPL